MQDTKILITSPEIAYFLGMLHSDVFKAISKMKADWEDITKSTFRLGFHRDSNGYENPQYELSKSECLYISAEFCNKSRAKLILHLGKLEHRKLMDRKLIKTVTDYDDVINFLGKFQN